jgi:alpha-1,3/alpha-1,6-mannosyltransferase
VDENVEYHNELVSLSNSLDLKAATTKNVVTALNVPTDIDVLFLLSVPAQLKTMLFNAATLLVYTPSNEHFGIVPLEAMVAGVPVLAANSGGPLETVVDGETGWLRLAGDISQWTEVMQKVLHGMTHKQLQQMGDEGRRWVKDQFSESKMASRLDQEIDMMVNSPRQRATELPDVLLGIGVLGMILTTMFVILFRLLR